ncbi:MAG TPA: aminotransferase class I/II-fold pyridoxal phosphate-dependent enzyme [Thermomicrobiales bacterium]|nr:aminotransferase class I/II-fold pyridoxal phosphate-dependent enzyme [Thermomicrobiales bacterium]
MDHARSFESIVTHGDHGIEETLDVAPPIHQTSTFIAETAEDFARQATDPRPDAYYTRAGNPTHRRAEAILAKLEGAEAGIVTASGMGAITCSILAHVAAGDHIVAQKNHYMAASKFVTDILPRFGVQSTVVDQTDPDAFAAAVRPETKVIFVETPSNPTGQITDLRAIANLAKQHGITTICDNTFASPINQQPIAHGIDVVVHSATKYLGGHHDLIAGAVLGSSEHVETIWRFTNMFGPTLGPIDAWLLLRGLRTLPLRVRHHNEVGCAVARHLEQHPKIEAVHYPGLPSHPDHTVASRQMTGYGGTFSFQVRGGYQDTQRFMSNLQMVKQAVSLGGFETLAVHAAAMWGGSLSDEQVREAGVEPNMVRISIGLETAEDVIADLNHALEAV